MITPNIVATQQSRIMEHAQNQNLFSSKQYGIQYSAKWSNMKLGRKNWSCQRQIILIYNNKESYHVHNIDIICNVWISVDNDLMDIF